MKLLQIAAVVLVLFLAGCSGTEQGEKQDSSQADVRASEDSKVDSESAPGGGSQGSSSLTEPEPSTVIIDASSGEEVRVRVEIADNPVSRFLGLRGRENLPENRGMLFVYSEERELSFTMEDTPTPLSIAFIDSKRRIIDIQNMEPFDDEPPGYDSPEPVQYALEVNKSFFDERGVKVGDRVELP
jgi:uncharacterized protein